MKENEGSDSNGASSARNLEGAPRDGGCACEPDASRASPPAGRARLFAGRRKFLIGGVGVSTFAATLASQPALAWGGGGGGGPITALCSPAGSHAQNTKPCVGYHCDYYCNTGKHWSSDCYKSLSSCGFKSQSGCNTGLSLKGALSSAYQQSSYHPSGSWGGQSWFGSHGQTYFYGSQHSGGNYGNGWWSYKSICDTGNLEAWLACGWLNAKFNSSNFGYTCDQFVNACNTVLSSKDPKCYTNIKSALCHTISSLCKQNRSPLPNYTCGGYGSIWTL